MYIIYTHGYENTRPLSEGSIYVDLN
jgi:hypothetical protein